MKQHITKEQWDEIELIQKSDFFLGIGQPIAVVDEDNLPNIGQMIEFLGDDLKGINPEYWDSFSDKKGHFKKLRFYCIELFRKELREENSHFHNKELCDALWMACCYKLKNI